MKKTPADILDFYDEEVVKLIVEKYNFLPMEALRKYLNSETYKMVSDAEFEMWDYGAPAIFDMWENEQITKDPRTSIYLRSE